MFRLTVGHLRIIKNIMRCSHKEYRVDITRLCRYPYKPQERATCPSPPPPPPPKAKDDTAFWGAMALLFVAAGFAAYAKQSPEIRDWITINAPWFDDIIAVAYEENMSYSEFAKKCLEDMKNYFNELKGDKPKQCSLEGPNKPAITVSKTPPVKASGTANKHTALLLEREPSPIVTEDGSGENKPPCEVISPPVVVKNICEVMECIQEMGNDVINNYYTALASCAFYNKMVEETMTNFSIPTMKKLHHYMKERKELVANSLKNIKESMENFDQLSSYLECGVQAPKADMDNAKTIVKDFRNKMKASLIKYQWEQDKTTVLDKQWSIVESVMDKYTEENQVMFPEIKYVQDELQLMGDLDLFIYHTFRYTNSFKNKLSDVLDGMKERSRRAYDAIAMEESKKDDLLAAAIKKKRAEMEAEFNRRTAAQNAANDKRLKDALKQQLDRQQESLITRVEEKEEEATVKLNKMVAERVANEKKRMAKLLKEMEVKVKLIEDKLNAHLKAESETKRSQDLWNAGASLLAATKKGEQYVKVDKEIKAIEKASGDGDKLVDSVLKAIPDSVRRKGVVPESTLKMKYQEMENVALKVALVESDGAPLPVYVLSWLQATFLFMKMPGIPQEEIEKLPKEPFTGLDTFDLLQRARFWLERDNLAVAIRYVNALEGASRLVASTWHDAAKAHLETRQAAEAILAHAAALGLKYI